MPGPEVLRKAARRLEKIAKGVGAESAAVCLHSDE